MKKNQSLWHLAAARLSDRGVLGMTGLLGPFPGSRKEKKNKQIGKSECLFFSFIFCFSAFWRNSLKPTAVFLHVRTVLPGTPGLRSNSPRLQAAVPPSPREREWSAKWPLDLIRGPYPWRTRAFTAPPCTAFQGTDRMFC